MICKNCKALVGKPYTKSEDDYTGCTCQLGHKTVIGTDGMMMSIKKCEKPKSWKALGRLMREKDNG